MTETGDDPLVSAAQAGDRHAVEELLSKYQDRVYRYGLRFCGNPGDAEDVMQETLLAMAKSLPSFERRASLTTWAYTIARSFCIKRSRKSKFAPVDVKPLERATLELASIATQMPNAPEDALHAKQTGALLERAVSDLEDEQREVLVLRDIEGLSAQEVADVLSISVAAVKSRLHRARSKLRQELLPMLGPRAGRPASSGCPDIVSLYSKYLENEIEAGVCRDMQKHLDSCKPCTSVCDSLKETLRLCGSLSAAKVPGSVQASVRHALRALLESPPTTLKE